MSRRCTRGSAADRRSVAEATMGAGEVVVLHPGKEFLVAFFGICVVARMGPFAQRGLDEAFGFAVGARSVGASETVMNSQLGASVVEQVGAIAVSVVGEQTADGDAVLSIEGDRFA